MIVVDDGSKDETAGLIRSRFGAVQVIEHGVNRGFGAAVNTGFRAAKGGFLSAVNNDARVSWDCLERLVRFLQEHHGAGAAAPLILDGAGRGQRVGFDFPRPPWQRPLRLARRSATARPEGGADAPYEAEYVRGACVVFRRAALDQAGLFDEQFHMFAEEIDLFRRLARVGWHAWVVPEATATHLAGVSTRNHSDPVVASRFRRQSYRSICLYYRKHHNWATAAVRALDRNPYLLTDDIHVRRDCLATRTPAHSEHTYWAQYAMWRMVTKSGDLRKDVARAVRDATRPPRRSAQRRRKTLLVRLSELLDRSRVSKVGYRSAKHVLPMLFSYLQTQYNLRTAFPPFHAKFLADRYLPHDHDCLVVDPCAGWGGRLLGTLCVPRAHRVTYLATDPNERMQDAYAGLTRRATIWLKRDIKAPRSATVFPKPFETWVRSAAARRLHGTVDMVMTSPPYFAAELYDSSPNQSAHRYKSYDLWRDKFYAPLIQGAFDLLRPGGVLVLNVANVTEARGLERDARRIARECGFRWHEYFRLLMPKTVGTRKGSAAPTRVVGQW